MFNQRSLDHIETSSGRIFFDGNLKLNHLTNAPYIEGKTPNASLSDTLETLKIKELLILASAAVVMLRIPSSDCATVSRERTYLHRGLAYDE
jgi:hypothetical protein